MLKGGLLSALSVPWLTSCRRHDSGELINALGWVPDVEYADLWVALERGYFAQQGIHLKVWPGGPNAPSRWSNFLRGRQMSAKLSGCPFSTLCC